MGSAMPPHIARVTLYGLSEIAEFIVTINYCHHYHQERASADWCIASYIGPCQRVRSAARSGTSSLEMLS